MTRTYAPPRRLSLTIGACVALVIGLPFSFYIAGGVFLGMAFLFSRVFSVVVDDESVVAMDISKLRRRKIPLSKINQVEQNGLNVWLMDGGERGVLAFATAVRDQRISEVLSRCKMHSKGAGD